MSVCSIVSVTQCSKVLCLLLIGDHKERIMTPGSMVIVEDRLGFGGGFTRETKVGFICSRL